MGFEEAAGLIALAWLVGAFLLMTRSIRGGRDLADCLAARHPELYESLGRPRPGYFESAQRSRFARFVARREFEKLNDPVLAARFEEHRRTEARTLGSLLTSLIIVGLMALAVQRAA